MADYEVLTRIAAGKDADDKPLRHAVGATIELDDAEAKRLIAIGAVRGVSAKGATITTEAGGAPVGTAQRAMAAATEGGPLSLVSDTHARRAELDKMTVKELDGVIAGLAVEVPASANKADKIDAIINQALTARLAASDRSLLLTEMGLAGVATDGIDLAADRADDEMRAALLRVAAAKAD